MSFGQGTNNTKFKLKHNNSLNPIASKVDDFSNDYVAKWDDTNQVFSEFPICLEDDSKIKIEETAYFNKDVTIGTSTNKATLHINGDIIQDGTVYESHLEDLFVKNSHIILRDGAIAGLLDGEHSGLIINKYDGTNDLHLCVGNSGFAQVGEDPNKDTTNTYEFTDYKIYKYVDPDDNSIIKYYDDPRYTLEHQFYIPKDAFDITYTEGPEQQDKTISVTIEYKLTEGSLQRLLTIDKQAEDQSLLYYDNKFKEAKTIILPDDQTKPLVPVLQGGRVNYREYTSGNGDGDANNWSGTTEQYENDIAITDEYDEKYIKDRSGVDIFDYEQSSLQPVSNKVQEGDLNPVTSNAVANTFISLMTMDYENVQENLFKGSTTSGYTETWTAPSYGLIVGWLGAYVTASEDNYKVIRRRLEVNDTEVLIIRGGTSVNSIAYPLCPGDVVKYSNLASWSGTTPIQNFKFIPYKYQPKGEN